MNHGWDVNPPVGVDAIRLARCRHGTTLNRSSVVILLTLSFATAAWAQPGCRERMFGGIGVAAVTALSDDRVNAITVDEAAPQPRILAEGGVRVACRVALGFETMSLGTVSTFHHYAPSLAFSQTESERL